MPNLFAYGSLMYEDVFTGVALCSAQCVSAQAIGWRRWALMNRTYPGAMPYADGTLEGILWLDVPQHAMARLDKFEGDEYDCIEIEVHTPEGMAHQALIYRWLAPDQIAGSWDIEAFDRLYRSSFVAIHGLK